MLDRLSLYSADFLQKNFSSKTEFSPMSCLSTCAILFVFKEADLPELSMNGLMYHLTRAVKSSLGSIGYFDDTYNSTSVCFF